MAINKTAISMLQELMVAKNQPIPTYTFRSIGTELQPSFSCSVETSLVTVSAEARNKKDAKQLAAKCALKELGYEVPSSTNNAVGVRLPNVTPSLKKIFIENKNYIGELHEFASGSRCSYPEYESPLFAENGQFKFICKFQGLETVGYGPNKKEAKQICSYEMILKLKSTDKNIIALPQSRKKPSLENSEIDTEVLKKLEMFSFKEKGTHSTSPCSVAYPEIKKNVLTIEKAEDELRKCNVKYEIKLLQTNPFIIVVKLGDQNMTLMGKGTTKNEATVNALKTTLEILQEGCSLIEL